MADLKDRVRAIAAEHLGAAPGTILDGTILFSDHGSGEPGGGLGDSLDRVEFTMALEEEFGIEIPESVSKHTFDTVEATAAYLERVRVGED